MAISSQGVYLKWGTTAANVATVVNIKDFPDLGGAPNMLECTTLADATQVFINGIKQQSTMEFTLNYDSTLFTTVASTENTALHYAIDTVDSGYFSFQGQHTVYVLGAGVDGVLEMKLVIAPSTAITKVPNLITVTIPGTPQQGSATGTLTKVYSNGTTPTPTLSYQWQIATTADGTYSNIGGATSATYTPVLGDVDKYLKVVVMASGTAGGTVTSAASAKIIGS
jgi:hypothetical protein